MDYMLLLQIFGGAASKAFKVAVPEFVKAFQDDGRIDPDELKTIFMSLLSGIGNIHSGSALEPVQSPGITINVSDENMDKLIQTLGKLTEPRGRQRAT